ncbi:MAG TPA: branched-chain amino acid ABC transporter permease [Thermoflexales bacterium]|nr:branched-chain amino acid ABC transporter permease [Thermoflexales bacterium]
MIDLAPNLQHLLNGLAVGSVYAMFALGYTLIFSILRIINFGHGAVFTLGAYFAYVLAGGRFGFNGALANMALLPNGGLPFVMALVAGAVLAGGVAVLIERIAFRPLRNRNADPLLTLVSSLGVAIVIVNLIQYLVGAEIYTYPSSATAGLPAAVNFGTADRAIPIRTIQILIFGVSMLMVMGLTIWMNFTRTGKALRAISEDATTASLLGINTDALVRLTFFISGFLGGVAGTLIGLSVSIAGPYFGIAFGLKGLAVIILGGLGSVPGAVLGGLLIGIAKAFVPASAIAYKEAIAFLFLFIVLLIRPQGLLGQNLVQKT